MITRETLINTIGKLMLENIEAQDTLIAANRHIDELENKIKKLEEEYHQHQLPGQP